MKEQIQQKIIEMIGEDTPELTNVPTDFVTAGYNLSLKHMREKAPQLAQEIVDMVVEEIENLKAREVNHIEAPRNINEMVENKLVERNELLIEIINLLKK